MIFHTFGDVQGACGRETVIGTLSECAEIAQLPRDWFLNACICDRCGVDATWRLDLECLETRLERPGCKGATRFRVLSQKKI